MKHLVWTLLILAVPAWAQKHELAFSLGGTVSDLDTNLNIHASSGHALQVNYGYRLWSNDTVAIGGEVHFLANPLREVTGASSLSRDFASLYLTPGIRAKFHPNGRLQPFGSIGGGYAWYEHSTKTIGGSPNPAPRELSRGAFTYGGGLDVKIVRWLALRGDVRDFYTGRPAYNLLTLKGGQHNVVASAGFVLRWGQ